MSVETAKTWQQVENNKNVTASWKQPKRDSKLETAKAWHPVENNKNVTAGCKQPKRDSKLETAKAWQQVENIGGHVGMISLLLYILFQYSF